MANAFLLTKWRKSFHSLDVNKDNLMSVYDADIFSENFSRHYKFDDEKAKKVKADCRRYWKECLLQGLDEADEATYLANLETAYLKDKAKFRDDARRLFGHVLNIIDINKDRLMSEDEFIDR